MTTRPIGEAGRRALDLARERAKDGLHGSIRGPTAFAAHGKPLSLAQRAAAEPSPAAGGVAAAPEAIEREMPGPSPEEVADWVYRLLCRELVLDRERQGGRR